jgi:hypothetical protein
MKNYRLNEHGVCENPSREIIFLDKGQTAIVYTAHFSGSWAFGYKFGIEGAGIGCFGSSGLPSFSKYRERFSTQEAARAAAIKIGIRDFQRAADYHNVKRVLDALVRAQAPQLTLF